MVVQFNKQDMDNVRTKAEIEAFGRRVNSAVLPATAIHGLGVGRHSKSYWSKALITLKQNTVSVRSWALGVTDS